MKKDFDKVKYIKDCEGRLKDKFDVIDDVALFNQAKVCEAFAEKRIAARHFCGTSGYGYGDEGRDCLGEVFARAFGAEAGIVSPHILSGTHALTVALFGILRPGDTLFCVSGMPYDTIRGVIYGEGNGSLRDFGIKFRCCDLTADGKFDLDGIKAAGYDSTTPIVVTNGDDFTIQPVGEGSVAPGAALMKLEAKV